MSNRYKSIPLRRSAQYAMRHTTGAQLPVQTPKPTQSYVSSAHMPAMPDDDNQMITSRTPNSAIRYTDEYGRQVVQQDGRRYIMHDEEELPPLPRRKRPRRQNHWLLYVGLGMIVALALWALASWAVPAWQTHQDDATYGTPRTYQLDAVVGHHDSAEHPTHFVFINLNRKVVIIELPGGDVSNAKIYTGPTLMGNNADKVPVTGEFRDVNGDGKVDMIVRFQDQTIIFINDGTKFVPQQN